MCAGEGCAGEGCVGEVQKGPVPLALVRYHQPVKAPAVAREPVEEIVAKARGGAVDGVVGALGGTAASE